MDIKGFDNIRLAVLAIGGLTALSLTQMLGTALDWQLWFMVPLFVLLGLPHGCLDLAIAQKLRPLPDVSSILVFVSSYLALAALVLGLWWSVPGVALGLFLGYSALHFAGDWREVLPGLRALPHGLVIVTIPAVAHHAETLAILTYLAPNDWAQPLADSMAAIALLMGPLALCLLFYHRASWSVILEFIGLVVLGLLTPPLIYFTLYFCFAHSPKHLRDTALTLALSYRGMLIRAAPIWTATIFGAVLIFLLLPGTAEAASLQVIFIGLAALTVPHMLLVEMLWRRQATLHANEKD